MEFRDVSIMTQVAFKEASTHCNDVDLTDDDGQSQFELVFSFLQSSLLNAVESATSEQMAEVIKAEFPGTTASSPAAVSWQGGEQVYPQPQTTGYVPIQQTTGYPGQQTQGNLAVKGNQFGPLPDWLFEAAAAKGVTEVYDNRDRATGTKRPWFKSTSGGDGAPAFWPPR